MTPEKIELVQASFAKVAPISALASDIFYDRLFAIAPDTRALFPRDLSEQKKKLMQMLAVAVNGLKAPDAIIPAVQALGTRHAGYGVGHGHYDAVGAALLHTLEQGLGDAFTADVRAAWADTYALLAGIMKEAQIAAKAA